MLLVSTDFYGQLSGSGFNASTGENGAVIIFSPGGSEIPPGTTKLGIVELEDVAYSYRLCLLEVIVSTNHGDKVEDVKTICGSDDFTPDAILTTSHVNNEGEFTIFIQASVGIDKVALSIYDDDGKEVQITHTSHGEIGKKRILMARLLLWLLDIYIYSN